MDRSNRFTVEDRQTLQDIKQMLFHLARGLDIDIQIGLSNLMMENKNMSDLTDALAARLTKIDTSVTANTDATGAVSAAIQGILTELATVKQQLADALAAGDGTATNAAIQTAIDSLDTITSKVDADTLATNALANTPAENV